MTGALLAFAVSAWTNVAGNVISAEPLRLETPNVVMRMEGANVETRLPLAAFPATERHRLRLATGAYELPRRAADVRTVFAADLARAEARAKAGRMTPEALAAKRARIAAAWARELGKKEHGLTAKEIDFWKGELGDAKK